MKIVLTGSLGNIGKPLTNLLVAAGHQVTVISSKKERITEIESLNAVAAIGSIQDAEFLTETFKGADAVYLMEAWEGIGSLFDKEIDFLAEFKKIAQNYVTAVQQSGIKKIIHLSSIGAHSDQGNGSLLVHYHVEQILQTLPEDVSIKFMRPVGFFSNMYRWLPRYSLRVKLFKATEAQTKNLGSHIMILQRPLQTNFKKLSAERQYIISRAMRFLRMKLLML